MKRTALGRIKHESATFTQGRGGRAVIYTGDDENGDYLYKYVSARAWWSYRWFGKSPLDDGTLHVAAFDDAGNGTWLPLVHGTGPLTVENGWVDQADVLIRTREAADALGATRLHRPEWVTVNERNKDVYVTLTNGSGSGAPVNSNRDPNPYGHIVRIREAGADNTATTFTWDIYVIGGDPAYDPTVPAGQPLFGSPDGVWADADGRIWIQTDVSNSSQNLASRGYDNIKNNQMLVGDPDTGEIRRFLTGPRGCEITGRHHHTRSAHHVRQRAASRRVDHVLEHAIRPEHVEPDGGEHVARRSRDRPPPPGHRGDPQTRRRQDRHLTS